MKSHARVVVIGGGAVGCSALYHLTRLGWTDVVLLERDELTAGSTWHAAGNCPNFSTSWNILKLQRHSTALYERLAQEVGYDINYHVTGSIRLAHTADRVDEFRHVASQARAQHLDFELLSPSQIKARHPFLELDGIRLGLWDPKDGDIDPAQLTQALAKGARDLGATVYRHTRVTAMRALSAGGWRIETPAGSIETEYVINAAGYRGGEVAAMIGEYLPIVPLSHQYLITDDIPRSSRAVRRACHWCATPTSATTCARSGMASFSDRMNRTAGLTGSRACRANSRTSYSRTILGA